MANEIIRPTELPPRASPVASEVVPADNGSVVGGITLEALVNAGRPLANQAEAEAGVNATKAMTPLTTKQAINAQVGGLIDQAIDDLNLGTAAQADAGDFATAVQGGLADSAVQPGDLAGVATSGDYDDLSNKPSLGDSSSLDVGVTAGTVAAGDDSRIVGAMQDAVYDPDAIGGNVFDSANQVDFIADDIPSKAIPAEVGAFRTSGFSLPGDGYGALWKKVAVEPSHGGKFQSADGAWWEKVTQEVQNNYAASNFVLTDSVDTFGDDPYGPLPATGAPYYNVIVGHGAKATGQIWRSTIHGALAATMLEEGERVEAYGNGALRFARFANRTTAIGSLALQWQGQKKSRLTDLFHDLWWPIPPSDPAWDAGGLETRNPGVRLKLLDVPDAVTSDDVRGNVVVGRDAQLHLIRGTFNTVLGYRAGARGVNVSSCVVIGRDALTDNVLGDFNVAVGAAAGTQHQEGGVNIYVGYLAGQNHVRGASNVFIGGDAAAGWTDGDRNVIIGYQAGQGVPQGNDLLAIQNLSSRAPLIAGDFSAGRAGVNLRPADLQGRWHVRAAASGATALATAATIISESSGSSGMSFLTPNNAVVRLLFADPQDNQAGGIQYSHSSDIMSFRAGGLIRVQINSIGLLITNFPTSDAGLIPGQVWNDGGTLKVAA